MKYRHSIVCWWFTKKNEILANVCSSAENLLPGWHKYSFHPKILMALHEKAFTTPTPIQAASLPLAFAGRDVIGVAQTVGSNLCRSKRRLML